MQHVAPEEEEPPLLGPDEEGARLETHTCAASPTRWTARGQPAAGSGVASAAASPDPEASVCVVTMVGAAFLPPR